MINLPLLKAPEACIDYSLASVNFQELFPKVCREQSKQKLRQKIHDTLRSLTPWPLRMLSSDWLEGVHKPSLTILVSAKDLELGLFITTINSRKDKQLLSEDSHCQVAESPTILHSV